MQRRHKRRARRNGAAAIPTQILGPLSPEHRVDPNAPQTRAGNEQTPFPRKPTPALSRIANPGVPNFPLRPLTTSSRAPEFGRGKGRRVASRRVDAVHLIPNALISGNLRPRGVGQAEDASCGGGLDGVERYLVVSWKEVYCIISASFTVRLLLTPDVEL